MPTAEPAKLKVFISYSRDDLTFADQLCAGLEALDFAPTLDRIGISGAADWRETLRGMILKSDTVVFVLSPSSARSEMCGEEVNIAAGLAKRIIPVVCQPLGEVAVPRRLQDLNYIFFYPEPKSPGSGFGAGLGKLKVALETDQDWMKGNTRYADRAAEWDAGGRKEDRLLQGTDIVEAQRWAESRPAYAPSPTDLQVAFIGASLKTDAARAAAQVARDVAARDAEIKRMKAEQEAERLRLDTAKIAAERAAAQAESKRRRQQLLISVPALVLAFAGIGGTIWQRQNVENERLAATLAQNKAAAAKAREEIAQLRAAVAEKNTESLQQLGAVQQSVRSAGRTAKAEEVSGGPSSGTANQPAPPPVMATPTSSANPGPPGTARTVQISDDAMQMMAAFEIGDKETYRRRLGKPSWPGAFSGVVIGIGYDLGYVSGADFARDWKDKLPAADFEKLISAIGIKSEAAKEVAARLSDIAIRYEDAVAVFESRTIPQYTARTLAAFPHADELHPDSLGALVSLVYNRGPGMDGDKRREMRDIRDSMQERKFEHVPDLIREMTRLWPDLPAIQRRRKAEAALFEKGLVAWELNKKTKGQ